MSEHNQYQAPRSQVDGTTVEQFAQMKVFAVNGRIGRVRYLAYSFGVNFVVLIIAGILAALMSLALGQAGHLIGTVLVGLAYIFAFVYGVTLAIRRSHDFNTSGWLSLLIFVPLANLIFLFIPGTQGENNYGAPPPPNTTGNIILAVMVPVMIIIIAILAAITIPAYQKYIQRTHEMQQQQQFQQR